MTHIRVSDETKRILDEVKEKMGLKSHDQVIQKLLEPYTDPRSAAEIVLSWILDIRDDVKAIRRDLHKLAEMLEKLD